MTDIDEQSEEIRGRGLRQSGGGSISSRDPRVSRLIAWGMGIFGFALVGIGSWIATTLMSLRDSVTTIVAQNAAVIYRLDKNDGRDDTQDAR